MSLSRVLLKPRRAQALHSRHPWVYAGAVAAVTGQPGDGGEVEVVSHEGNFVARGLYNARSKIIARLYGWEPDAPLDRDFFRGRLERAVRLRRDALKLMAPGTACRLVFSEGDGLSGLTADRYGDWLTVQFTALGLGERRLEIAGLLAEQVGAKGVYLRTEKGIGKLEGLQLQDGLLLGEPPPADLTVTDDGLQYRVNVAEGQKTGFYLDQRDNRRAFAAYTPGKRVLDAFCYSGGFAMQAARAGAAHVEAVDGSEPALDLGRANAELNGFTGRISFLKADVFDRMAELAEAGEKFGAVVLDPPKFARARHAIPEALRGYRRLQALALRLLEPEGVLCVCCCSGLIEWPMLEAVLADAAGEARRDVQILERRGQAADHPVYAACPESSYLKCLIARVC